MFLCDITFCIVFTFVKEFYLFIFSFLLHFQAKSRLFLWAKSPVCRLFKGITWEQLCEKKAVRDAHLTLNQNMSVKHKCLALDENLIYQWNWMWKSECVNNVRFYCSGHSCYLLKFVNEFIRFLFTVPSTSTDWSANVSKVYNVVQ